MKRFLVLVIVLVLTILIYLFLKGKSPEKSSSEAVSISLKKNSDLFNMSVMNAMEAYMEMKDAFVESDTETVKRFGMILISALDSIPLNELGNDTDRVYQSAFSMKEDIKANITSLLSQNNVTDMKKDFSMAGDMIFPGFLKLINYEGPRLYLQHCPMAFGEDMGANWISKENTIMNPYLGKSDPTFGAGMLHCGEVKDSMGGK